MKEEKLKFAFEKVKNDVNFLNLELKKVQKAYSLNEEIKEKIDQLKELDLENFAKRLENDFKNLNNKFEVILDFFNNRSADLNIITSNIQNSNNDLDIIKKKICEFENKFLKNEKKMIEFEKSFFEYMELSNEKLEMEKANLSLNYEEKNSYSKDMILKFKEDFDQLKFSQKQDRKNLEELNELINEKLEMEMSTLKLELFDEIAKIYTYLDEKETSKKTSSKK